MGKLVYSVLFRFDQNTSNYPAMLSLQKHYVLAAVPRSITIYDIWSILLTQVAVLRIYWMPNLS